MGGFGFGMGFEVGGAGGVCMGRLVVEEVLPVGVWIAPFGFGDGERVVVEAADGGGCG